MGAFVGGGGGGGMSWGQPLGGGGIVKVVIVPGGNCLYWYLSWGQSLGVIDAGATVRRIM